MGRFFAILLFALIAAMRLHSQVLPGEGSSLNYRLIGFSFSPGAAGARYKIEVAKGHFSPDDPIDSFKRNIVASTAYAKDTKLIIEVPSFGKQYTWRVVTEGKANASKAFHHFSTSVVNEVDTSAVHLRVLQKATHYQDAYVFLDGCRALFDMNGNAVWYLPDIDSFKTGRSDLRDLKATPQGTISFLFEEHAAYEVNYNGQVLWKARNDGSANGHDQEYYHHELTRLENGHYMLLGSEWVTWNQQAPSGTDSSFVITHADTKKPGRDARRDMSRPFGTIIEYDEKGRVVWTWRSASYFRTSDIYYHKAHGNRVEIAPHENSFYFDEKDSVIYVAFRNISRIVKLKYPEGKVLATYGEEYTADKPEAGNSQFCRQHSVRRSDRGYLYLYNNNVCPQGTALPQVLKFKEPASGRNLEKIWEYNCTTEGATTPGPFHFPTGGNVIELPDHSLLVNMSTSYSKVFIVSEDKQILWSAIPEKWNEQVKAWQMVYDYRASILMRKDLEQLIWNAEYGAK